MTIGNYVLRGCAIVFGTFVSGADGNATILQAVTSGWARDTVIIAGCAVAYVAVGPTFIREAWRRLDYPTMAVLTAAFIVCGVVSCHLTFQRIVAQFDKTHHATAKENHPIVLTQDRLVETRKAVAAIKARIVAKKTQRKQFASAVRAAAKAMDAAENDPALPGRGPKWRAKRDLRVAEQAKLEAVVDELVTADADLAEAELEIETLRAKLEKLGPKREPSFVSSGMLVGFFAAAVSPFVSIALFLFAASPIPVTNCEQREVATSPSFTELHATSNSVNFTCDTQLEKTPASKGDPAKQGGVESEVNMKYREVSRSSRLPPKGSGAYRAAVVQDMLAAAKKYGRMPTYSQCQRRYNIAPATTSKYRAAAIALWEAHQARMASVH